MTESVKGAAAKSWKTTACGLVVMLGVLLEKVAQPLLDGIQSTEPDWGAAVAATCVFVGLLSARDHGVSSEDAGLKESCPPINGAAK